MFRVFDFSRHRMSGTRQVRQQSKEQYKAGQKLLTGFDAEFVGQMYRRQRLPRLGAQGIPIPNDRLD